MASTNNDTAGEGVMDNIKDLQLSSRALLKSMRQEFQGTEETVAKEIQTEDSKGRKTIAKETTNRRTIRTVEGEEPLLSPLQETELRSQQERIIWRDFTFLLAALALGSIMSWVEIHSSDVTLRGGTLDEVSKTGIVDTGFILTRGLHDYLEQNRWVNDLAAGINTVIGVLGPLLYMVYQTLWVGDYDVVFRYLAISAIRSLCGWVTFLPPDSSYLVSYYDFPDIAQCLLKDCGDPRDAKVQPFVSFFSGHVATLVINANHMYVNGFQNLAIFFHIFNIFQIIRLLATRGHYSIDIVIGWYMAVYVSNPAGRVGRHFSRGDKSLEDLYVPVTSRQVFERFTGITAIQKDRRVSQFLQNPDIKDSYDSLEIKEKIAEPTARLVAEGKLESTLFEREKVKKRN